MAKEKKSRTGRVMISLTLSVTQADVFFYIPLGLIIVEGQIRSRINQEGEVYRKGSRIR